MKNKADLYNKEMAEKVLESIFDPSVKVTLQK